MTIEADFTKVNGEKEREDAVSEGTIDPDGSGPLQPIAARVEGRGVSRFQNCGFRPLTVRFPEKQKGNVFEHLGKSVQFSTHCGDREGVDQKIFKAPSLDEYYQRVRMEHSVYEMLDQLETLSLKTRLVEITYRDTATGKSETHLAFAREPKDELAQRCGMVEGEDIPMGDYGTNYRADLLATFLMNFVLHTDNSGGKNRLNFVDLQRGLKVDAPYDFDTVGIFRRDYAGVKDFSLTELATRFGDWLRRNNTAALQEEAQLILARSAALRGAYEAVNLSPANKALFDEWFDAFTEKLRAFAACEDRANDATDKECFVPDEWPSAPSPSAEAVAPGEFGVLLEPPGDIDVVKVELPPGKRYSFFVGSSDAKVLSANSDTLFSKEGLSPGTYPIYCVPTAAAEPYYVSLSRGDELVCSEVGSLGNPEPLAVYEDDYCNTSEGAAPLSPGKLLNGKLELDSVAAADEDWFTVTAAAGAQLKIKLTGSGAGFAEAFLKAEGVSAGSAPIELSGPFGDEPPPEVDLSSLFPGPGEYVIRIVQYVGTPLSYELQLD